MELTGVDRYQQMWESWVSGDIWGAPPLEQSNSSFLSEGQGRIKDFYNMVVGPASGGGAYVQGEGFGDIYGDYLGTGRGTAEGWTTKEMEQAEREFRLSIGDPYEYGENPFAWERVSRMTPQQAQDQLVGELYGQGKMLGGELGSEYGTATAKELEEYTTGLTGEREALTYGTLTSGVSLASGTSGAVLRSGEGVTASEDVLIEAYKKAKSLGSGYREGMEGVGETLEADMSTALTRYLDALEGEKQDWYALIMSDVESANLSKMAYEFDLGERWGEEEFAEAGVSATGMEYVDEDFTMRDEACGIGMLYDPTKKECVLDEELELESDKFGYLCEPRDVDECGVCDGPGPGMCWDGSYECDLGDCPEEQAADEEQTQLCGRGIECNIPGYSLNEDCMCVSGDDEYDPTEVDCRGVVGGTEVFDECGVCGGDGSSCAEVYGCTDPYAANYNEAATVDDGSCIQEEDEEQECPQDKIKTETGDCIDDPRLEEFAEKVTCWDGSIVSHRSECPRYLDPDPIVEPIQEFEQICDDGSIIKKGQTCPDTIVDPDPIKDLNQFRPTVEQQPITLPEFPNRKRKRRKRRKLF